jgi:hypothetical protein
MVNTPLFSGKTSKKADARNVSITGDTNIFAQDIIPGYTPLTFFAIYAAFETQGQLKVKRTFTDFSPPVTKTEILNEANNLVPDGAYMFAIPVSDNESINFWFSASTTCIKLTIIESQVE